MGEKMNNKQHNIENHQAPFLAVDIIIEYSMNDKEYIVLIERENFPKGIALPGGFAEYGLTLEENAVKESKEETNLEVIIENPEHPLCVHSDPYRDPRGHVISVTYTAKGSGILRSGDDARSTIICPIDEISLLLENGDFAFNDHKRALQDYLKFRGYAK